MTMLGFHFHTWKVFSRMILPSLIEQLGNSREIEFAGGMARIASHKPVIVTYECGCGSEKVERI